VCVCVRVVFTGHGYAATSGPAFILAQLPVKFGFGSGGGCGRQVGVTQLPEEERRRHHKLLLERKKRGRKGQKDSLEVDIRCPCCTPPAAVQSAAGQRCRAAELICSMCNLDTIVHPARNQRLKSWLFRNLSSCRGHQTDHFLSIGYT